MLYMKTKMELTIDLSNILQYASEQDCSGTHVQSHIVVSALELPSIEVQILFARHDTCVPWCASEHDQKRMNLSLQDD
ncbi:Os07g0493601 [Oryza sativa Japonica Group]|uniref:Os07g0493601 protein n=1 Tax=Oryza sativa subsp. japonica TaxID=39947 RepID=A0A0P0X6F1_ORYSJ|nr:Os07g0493601 [Oryza sativa Japonica Group]